MKVRCCGQRIKALAQARQLARREGNLRVVRRAGVLLEVGMGRPVGR